MTELPRWMKRNLSTKIWEKKTKEKERIDNEVMEKKKKDHGSFGRISQKHLKQQELRRRCRRTQEKN